MALSQYTDDRSRRRVPILDDETATSNPVTKAPGERMAEEWRRRAERGNDPGWAPPELTEEQLELVRQREEARRLEEMKRKLEEVNFGGLENIIRAAQEMTANMPNTRQWGRRAIDWYGTPDEEGVSGGADLSIPGFTEEIIKEAMGEPGFEPGPWDMPHPNMSALRATDLGRPSTWEEREPGLGRGPEESLWDLYQRKQAELHNPAAPPSSDAARQAALWQGIQIGPDDVSPYATSLYNPANWLGTVEDVAGAVDQPAPEEWGAAGAAVYALLDLLPYALAGA